MKIAPVVTLTALAVAAGFAALSATPLAARRAAMEMSRDEALRRVPVALCFLPGTSIEEQAAVRAQFQGATSRYFVGSGWAGQTGTGVTLRYSFPPDGVATGNGPNVLHATLNAQFASVGGEAAWKSLFRQSFDRWTEITGNTYIEVSDDGGVGFPSADGPFDVPGAQRGDVRIVMGDLGTGGTLAANFFPPLGDMILNQNVNFAANSGSNYRFFRNIILHEHGHGLSMSHSCPGAGQTGGNTKLMEPFISLAFDGPQLDDIRGAHLIYGDRFEPSTGDLSALGLVPDQTFELRDVSLTNFDDTDIYLFDAPAPSRVSVTLIPVGGTYRNGPQNGDGSCSAGTNLNADVLNLRLDLLSQQGQTLATSNSGGFGQSEVISNVDVAVATELRIRVAATSAASNDVQVYRLQVLVEDLSVQGDLNNDGFVTSTDLGILLGSWGNCPSPPLQCPADLNDDGMVNAADLASLLGGWSS